MTSILILSYTRGVLRLSLVFKNKEDYLTSKPKVVEILSFLEGYKIFDEKANKVFIYDTYNGTNISIREAAKRMCIILNNMIESILKSKEETKNILEKEADKLIIFLREYYIFVALMLI
ncbi:MAG: hypothetical protein QW103_01235 [Candidatus Pacearchaeota archaeon]